MTTVLALDTSSKSPSLAVVRDNELITLYNFISKNDLSSTLIPSMEMVLGNLAMTLADIDLLGVTTGPGIFTGIRVGLATIKGLMFDCNKPVVPLYATTLTALKCSEFANNKTIVPLIDARRDEVYTATLNNSSFKYPEPAPALLNIADIPARLEDCEDICFTGSGAEVHEEFLLKNFPGCRIEKITPWLAETAAKTAMQLYAEGHFTTDPAGIEPCYIRKPDAETNFRKNS